VAEGDVVARRLFERIRAVEWNEEKAASNRRKHGIDFDDAIEVFYGECLLRRSDRNMEERWIGIGESEGRVVAIVFTWRGDTLRIISARRASRNEKRAYYQEKMGRAPEGKN
jgi:uncharacterized DUF497 family protein